MVRSSSPSRFNNVKVWIEDDNGTLLDFPTSAISQPFSSQAYSQIRFIHIKAFTIPLSVVYLRKDPIFDSVGEDFYRRALAFRMKRDGYYIKFEVD